MQTKARRKGAALDLAGREVPEDAGDELLDVGIGTAHEEAHQRRDAAGLVQRSLVLVVLPAVRQVPVPRSNHQVQSSSPIIKSNHQVQSRSSPYKFLSPQSSSPIIKSSPSSSRRGPYRRAPQALRWTSAGSQPMRATSGGMPPRRRVCCLMGSLL